MDSRLRGNDEGEALANSVIPAQAGIRGQVTSRFDRYRPYPWIPACAGMTIATEGRSPSVSFPAFPID
ncbi:hypothetical protein ASE91_15860 [Sphingomonas sp. Leaf62]|nr:hypothetical protein ASE91_15860 [Sphingomonas sp. Leaf62]